MSSSKQEILQNIRQGLNACWSKQQEKDINAALRKIAGKTVQGALEQHRKKQDMQDEADAEFKACWTKLLKEFGIQYDILYRVAEEALLKRHPWLRDEVASDQPSLKDIFLYNIVDSLLFDSLENKPKSAKTWATLLITPDKAMRWVPIDNDFLINQIESCPLSNLELYNDRLLPSFLSDPFSKSPTRYDLYRLLKKNYPKQFQPERLEDSRVCTSIAPLHHTELGHLSDAQWDFLETIVVNIGDEHAPEWVLMEKKEEGWVVYAPEFLESKCKTLFENDIVPVTHKSQGAYSEITDWHAVLFSRVLPWCLLPQRNKPGLDAFRSTLPIPLLLQNSIEASCLPAQSQVATVSRTAFSKRKPLSLSDEQELYFAKSNTPYLFPKIPETSAEQIIELFASGVIDYEPDTRQLTISDSVGFIEGMKLAYQQHVKRLVLDIKDTLSDDLKHWFTYNLDLIHIEPSGATYAYPIACAARNRFLIHRQYLHQPDPINAAKTAWKNAGVQMYDFLKETHNPDPSQLRDIAEMGVPGLDALFTHLNTLLKPALSCTLDLESGQTLDPSEYIRGLTDRIESFRRKPLFSKLELILPQKITEDTQAALTHLIKILNERGEMEELILHNPANIKTAFIKALQDQANSGSRLQINIPTWNDAAITATEKGRLKGNYRVLQNTILGNIRQARESDLDENTQSLRQPRPIRRLKDARLTAVDVSWREGASYSLKGSVGVQQQAEQEIAKNVQQEAEQQSEPKPPSSREIVEYSGDHTQLITRRNVEEKGAKKGIKVAHFSQWVGSTTDAPFVIQGMDAAAFNKTQEFHSLFRFAIDWQHTPGFRLCYLPNERKDLILTYDETKVAEDTEAQQLVPFAIQMNHSNQAKPFYGDYRQIKLFADKGITPWHYLATETLSKAVTDWLTENDCSPETSESMQQFNVNGRVEHPADSAAMIAMMKQWAQSQLEIPDNEPFLSALFDTMTPHNLRAFGQLFYHYESQGAEQWLHLVHALHERFPGHFHTFKQRVLDSLHDWSETLEKDEVDAITDSLQKLKDHPTYQAIFWSLMDKHGETVVTENIAMHYAEVWRAYNRVIDYIDANNLHINEHAFLETIKAYPDFNATQFLRRLYEVLQHTGNRQDSEQIQQEILNNLDAIDWHENGFYYACVHENYGYWDERLALHGLQRLDKLSPPSYIVAWDIDTGAITDPVGFTLRYAAQRLKLPKADFDTLKGTLVRIDSNNTDIIRLITASIALGLDTVKTIDGLGDDSWEVLHDSAYQPILQQINQVISLDAKERVARSLHVKMSDLPILLEVLSEQEGQIPLTLEVINALGRALQAYSGDKKSQLCALIQYGMKHGFEQPLVTAYPWLLNDAIDASPFDGPEHQKFFKQLSSIDFEHSTLPNRETLILALESIHSAEDRHQEVGNLINKRCFITDQDAAFRVLDVKEKQLGDSQFLSKTFGKQNRLLLNHLFDRMAITDDGHTHEKIKHFLTLLSRLDKKSYYDELGQLLGLLVEKSQDSRYYSLDQLSIWIDSVYDENAFKTKPYPVGFIRALLSDALTDPDSSLLSRNLHQLQPQEKKLEPLQGLFRHLNASGLSNSAKQVLVNSAVAFKYETHLDSTVMRLEAMLNQLQNTPDVSTALCRYMTTQLKDNPAQVLAHADILEQVVSAPLSENNQIKLLDGLATGKITDPEIIPILLNARDPIPMILCAAFSESDSKQLINSVKTKLARLDPSELQELAHYCQSEPRPNLEQLNQWSSIEYFERVTQAEGKRNYSLSAKDAGMLKRVLDGFQLKKLRHIDQGEQAQLLQLLYYGNHYSQAMDLQEKSIEDLLALVHTHKQENTDEAKARVLACMREIMLRKTGKWVNHTQMLALTYAAMHNDESLMHQIRTGEGKSIITLMRVAYRALNGQNIDVFSSKESLSFRDHQEFAPVYDAFGIRHSYITANSNPLVYQHTVDAKGVGSVNYATIGNFSLFIQGLHWEGKDTDPPIDLHADNRVAFLDEGDHIMRFEDTLFNYSDRADAESVYNYDAWIYQTTYEFYLNNYDRLAAQEFNVNEIPDLQALCQHLQEDALRIAPDKSAFFEKYLASGDSSLRNQKLLGLLTAAHLAQGLEEGVQFCVMPDQKKISKTETLDTRCAKVMINNQVYHGSTYSDLVQQFLHVRLNKEAVKKGETPNYFVDPESEVALSLNARHVLKNYYRTIESCTGTPGSDEALDFYRDEFGIRRVIKLPTHEDIKTTFLPPIYADGEEAQIRAIVADILENPGQPVLITCEDDKAVAHLGQLIQQMLGATYPVVIDTNDKGLSEDEVLKKAGKAGAITVTSSKGRGSNIQPDDRELGLRVIRTYAAVPEIRKQEEGRQGRNAAGGICREIIDNTVVTKEYEQYKENSDFIELLAQERLHLETKLTKHRHKNKDSWEEIKHNAVLKEQYLLSRTVQRFKHKRQEANKRHMRVKDDLIAEGSGQVMEQLSGLAHGKRLKLKAAWKLCAKSIATAWAADPESQEPREILNKFYHAHHISMPKAIQRPELVVDDHKKGANASIQALTALYQTWLISMPKDQDPNNVEVLYGKDFGGLDALYGAFQGLTSQQIETLAPLLANPLSHGISCMAWKAAVELIIEDPDIAATYAERVGGFFKKHPSLPQTKLEIQAFSQTFLGVVAGVPDVQFIETIIEDMGYIDAQRDELLARVNAWPRQVVDLCRQHMNKEDIVFFLDISIMYESQGTRYIDYLVKHYQILKSNPDKIRPYIALLFQANVSDALLDEFVQDDYPAILLSFLSQRPDFSKEDYQDLLKKINGVDERHRPQFLAALDAMPSYLGVRAVLTDLRNLPGKRSFDEGNNMLKKHMKRMATAATAFNTFLCDHDVISNKEDYVHPLDEDAYETWRAIFHEFTLDQREQFFGAVKKCDHYELEVLKGLAMVYASGKISNQELNSKVKELPEPKDEPTPHGHYQASMFKR